jgi:hypothetical protein
MHALEISLCWKIFARRRCAALKFRHGKIGCPVKRELAREMIELLRQRWHADLKRDVSGA